MPIGVVHLLEPVQVGVKQSDKQTGASGARPRFFKMLQKEADIGQVGQVIVGCHVLQLELDLFALGNVPENSLDTGNLSIFYHWQAVCLNVDVSAILAKQLAFDAFDNFFLYGPGKES